MHFKLLFLCVYILNNILYGLTELKLLPNKQCEHGSDATERHLIGVYNLCI